MNIIEIRMLTCNYSLDPDKPCTTEDLEIEIMCGRHFDDKSKVSTGRVIVKSKSDEKPYSFIVEYGGKFILEEEEISDEQTFKRINEVNIPAIIYAYIREHISDLSRRSGVDPIFLPPLNFVNLAQQGEELPQGETFFDGKTS